MTTTKSTSVKNSPPPPPPPWTRHRVFWYAVVARCGLAVWRTVLSLPLPYYLETNQAVVASLVTDPAWTVSFMRMRFTDDDYGTWQDEVKDSNTNAGMTILAMTMPLLQFLLPLTTLGMALVSLCLTLVDYDIAQQWQQLATRAAARFTTEQQDDLIQQQQQQMPESIRPKQPKLMATLVQFQPFLPLLYFANPVVILRTAVYDSAANVPLWLLLRAVNLHLQDNKNNNNQKSLPLWPMLLLALAGTCDASFVVFAVALLQGTTWEYTTLLYTAIQVVVGYFLTGTLPLLQQLQAQVNNTTPPVSLSVLWYTHIQFFTRFAAYLKLVLGWLPYIVIVPCAIRLYKYPLVLVAIYWMLVHTLCHPVSTLPDLLVGCMFMLLEPASCARMNIVVTLVSLCALGVPVALYVVLHPLWLQSGAGEANFLYFQCLAYQIFAANITLQFTSASLQRDKAVRLTEKIKDAPAISSLADKDHGQTTENDATPTEPKE